MQLACCSSVFSSSVAKRISWERGENVGETAGYKMDLVISNRWRRLVLVGLKFVGVCVSETGFRIKNNIQVDLLSALQTKVQLPWLKLNNDMDL
ncbi:hypothetical protein MKW98_011363 [Papaver atlanticum]|uniref:Uncharacterized protein n=1 Tax=Papaver atlanticum TaxID=357466 RepID=A0AAD4STY4_9MAGN|nr:hypothetical protein MKW98_011363 [Papaver atlanticum]